jgi:hypothetical protein
MLSPATVVGDVVTKLRLISTLATALEGSASALIYAYADDRTAHRSLAEAIDALETGAILAAYMGLAEGARGEMSGWRHQVALFWKPQDEAQTHAVIAALANGVPTGSVVALPYAQINASLDPMDEIVFSRAANADGVEYWTCTFGLAEVWG